MRQSLFIAFLLLSLAGFGQVQTGIGQTQSPILGNPSTVTTSRGAIISDVGYLNTIRDTTFTPLRAGLQVYRAQDSSLYVAVSITTRPFWKKIGSEGADLSAYALTSAIPTNLSQLTNGPGYITNSALSGYALTSAIPTNNNQLTNGAGYLTSFSITGKLNIADTGNMLSAYRRNGVPVDLLQTATDVNGIKLDIKSKGTGVNNTMFFTVPDNGGSTIGFGANANGMYQNFNNLDGGYAQAWSIDNGYKTMLNKTQDFNYRSNAIFFNEPHFPVYNNAMNYVGGRGIRFFDGTPPTTGKFDVGDIAFNKAYNGTSVGVIGWVNTVSSSTGGTWAPISTVNDTTGGTTGITIVNNATTTTANTILDGRMGKTLNDAINTKQGALTLTTTGSSGAATLTGSTLNIPQYSGGGGITYPNTATKYLNGYGNFPALNTDSIAEGATNKFFTDSRARNSISLTTTGSSGAATYTGGVLNIPNYSGGVTDGDKGDVTISGSGSTFTLDKVVNASKIAATGFPSAERAHRGNDTWGTAMDAAVGLKAMQGLGYSVKAVVAYMTSITDVTSTTPVSLSSGQARIGFLHLHDSTTVNGFTFIVGGGQTITPTNFCGMVLYRITGADQLTLAAYSESGASYFATSNTPSNIPISGSTPVTVPPGTYYIGILANFTGTAPTVAVGTAGNSSYYTGAVNNKFPIATTTAAALNAATPPTTIVPSTSSFVANASRIYMAIY